MRGEGWEMRQSKGPCPGVVDAPPSIMNDSAESESLLLFGRLTFA